MDYKLTRSGENDVEYIAPAGSSFVRSIMPEGSVIGIIATASKVEKSDKFDGFGICVNDGEYYFAGAIGKAESKAKSEPKAGSKATDEPVKAEKKPVAKKTAKK